MQLGCFHDGLLADASSLELVFSEGNIGCGVGKFAHAELELSHLLCTSFQLRRHRKGHFTAHLRRFGNVFALSLGGERTASRHAQADLAGRYSGYADTHGVVIACIEHVHDVCTHRSGRCNDIVFLFKITANLFAAGIHHFHESLEGELSRGATYRLVDAALVLQFPSSHEDGRAVGGVYGRHDNLCTELATLYDGETLWDDVGIEFVDTYVLDTDVAYQRVEHLSLRIAYVILQFGEERHGSTCGHGFEHILLPVLSHRLRFLRNVGTQVALDDAFLQGVRHQG